MYCEKCGVLLDENNVCPNCNTQTLETESDKLETANDSEKATAKKYSGKSITGFVLSLVGILVAAIPCGIIGLVFSALGMKDAEINEYKGKGLAISGLIISIIDIVLGLIIVIA